MAWSSRCRMGWLGLTLPWLTVCTGNPFQPQVAKGPCQTTTDCAGGLVCAHDHVCRGEGEPGTVELGNTCFGTVDCRHDLVCSSSGTCVETGSPGTAQYGEFCSTSEDCVSGLDCVDDVCGGFEQPFWEGQSCAEEDSGPFRLYFQVPRDGPTDDFYRIPFPNDALVESAGLELQGHASPGPLLDVVGDVVGNILRVAELEHEGFGTNQFAFLRLSRAPDLSTVDIGVPGQGTVSLVDITPDAAEYGETPPMSLHASTASTRYICDDWLAVGPRNGYPLLPGHTYAVMVSTRMGAQTGGLSLARDDDFVVVMSDEPPVDPPMRRAWDRYAPLRQWLDDEGISRDLVAGAAVFTTQDPLEPARRVREAALAQERPVLTGAILCGTDEDPYATAEDRGCQTDSEQGFWEVQGTIGLPQFQRGTPPFKSFVDGGEIDVSDLQLQRLSQVHVTLTVPTGVPMPDNGWPLALYAHGSNGNYTSAVREGVVDALTTIDLGLGVEQHYATLSFDAPLHGPRARPENWEAAWLEQDPHSYDSDLLFFNPFNVSALRDNPLQMAADLWTLTRWVRWADWDDASSPTGEALRFDPGQLAFVGHGLGATVGPLFVAHEPEVDAVVLAGGGGLVVASLLGKTRPRDVTSAMRTVLADSNLTREHPLLNILQSVVERSDGINHAQHLLQQPLGDAARRHVLQVIGVDDTYIPQDTQDALALVMGVDHVAGSTPPLEGIPEVTLPVTGNVSGATGVALLYTALDQDAHDVLFDRADAQHHMSSFLGTLGRDGVPTVEPL